MYKLKFALSVAFMLIAVCTWAQPKTGDIAIGGGLNFNALVGEENYSSTRFTFNPSLGYFLTDNVMLQANMDVSASATHNGSTSARFRSRNIGIGPGATYFVGSGPIQPFVSAGVSIGSYFEQSEIAGFTLDPVTGTSLGFAVSAGVAYWLVDYLAIQGTVNYSGGRLIIDGTGNSTGQYVNAGVGVRWIWSR